VGGQHHASAALPPGKTRYPLYRITHYFAGDIIEKNEMGGACSSDGEEERRVEGFGGET
jgi:hypothetical protein